MRLWLCGLLVAFSSYAADPGAPVTVDTLVQDLGGADKAARVTARQLLPKQSIEAVPKLFPLLNSENPDALWAAMRVLEDFANQVGVAGREKERQKVTDAIMTLLAKEQSPVSREKGLRLLPLVVPEGYDVAPMAALLRDAEWREKARESLSLLNTHEARKALADVLKETDDAFRVAVLDGFAVTKHAENVKPALAWAKEGTPEVRLAAARALAWTADMKLVPLFQSIRTEVPDALRKDAEDILLRLADNLARSGGKWEYAMRIYRDVLKTSASIPVRGAAVSGLGRYGDDTVVADIIAATASQRDLEGPALNALRMLSGNASSQAMLEAYPSASESMRAAMLDVFGSKKDARFLPFLNEATKSTDPQTRTAAVAALSASELPGAVEALAGLANTGSAEDKALATGALTAMASAMVARGESDAAGKAYYGLYRAAATDELRAQALEGIKRYPVAESFDLIIQHLGEGDVAKMDAGTLAGLVKALFDAGRKEEGQKLIAELFPRMTAPGDVRKIVEFLLPILGPDELAKRLGVVRKWRAVGPFPWSAAEAFTKTHINEPNVDLKATYTEGKDTLSWKPVETGDLLGVIDFMGSMGTLSNVSAYAFTRIHVDAATDAQVRCGSDDGIKVWVNGVAVHENNVDRGTAPDSDRAPIKLKAGDNDLLVRVTQGGGGWNFCLRLTQPDGRTLAFTPVDF